ncbi:DUF1573 domain-containing protein [Shiella aurantiaca]|nr:DUF1573 domain-containing protein [Shiella aurantiaca]
MKLFSCGLVLMSLVLAGKGKAQGVPEFEQVTYDFGTVEENEGSLHARFRFKNVGNEELLIAEVQAECGCTSPSWTRQRIMPSDTGSVVVAFQPFNRPGPFNKTVEVKWVGKVNPVTLAIEGRVKPSVKSVEDKFPYVVGGMRFSEEHIYLRNVLTKEEPVLYTLHVLNTTADSLRLTKYHVPSFIDLDFPKVLPPHTQEAIEVRYWPHKRQALGYVRDTFELVSNEKKKAAKFFQITATIEEYFPPISPEERDQSPTLILEKSLLDLGSFRKNTQVQSQVMITNTGKKPLNIRQVSANCDCMKVAVQDRDIQPRQSTSVVVTFNGQGRKGNQQKMITVFSNDPKAPTQVIIVKGNILD